MKVGELNSGMLLLPATGFGVIITQKKLLRFMHWVFGDVTSEPMVYIGRKQGDSRRLHEVMFMGEIHHVDSFDFRYVTCIN